MTAGLSYAEGETLLAFGQARWQAEGAVAIADAYKWLHQATQGGEHALGDPADAQAWLEREWASLDPPAAEEPLLVSLRPDGQVVRLQLRAYRAAGGEPQRLLDAFLTSAARVRPHSASFANVWQELGAQLRRTPSGALTSAAWSAIDDLTAAQGYPAVRHSPGYQAAHRPAYRVLAAPEAERLALGLR